MGRFQRRPLYRLYLLCLYSHHPMRKMEKIYLAPTLCIVAMFLLHTIYGREYIMYSYNWHGCIAALIVAVLYRIYGERRKRFLVIILGISALILVNNLMALEAVYDDFRKDLRMTYREERSKSLEWPSYVRLKVTERCSAVGNRKGSITDENTETLTDTFNNRLQHKAWFEVEYDPPIRGRYILFCHGKNFHNGGWFDTSEGKPEVWIAEKPGDELKKVGVLTQYPETTARDHGNLKNEKGCLLKLQKLTKASRVRVTGKPSCGDDPSQSFASCSELWLQ